MSGAFCAAAKRLPRCSDYNRFPPCKTRSKMCPAHAFTVDFWRAFMAPRFLQCITIATLTLSCAALSVADDSDKQISWRMLDASKRLDAMQTRQLIEAGAAVNARDREGETPLMIWVKAQNEEMVVWLLGKGANVNQAAVNETTPLMAGAYAGNARIMRLLLDAGAE